MTTFADPLTARYDDLLSRFAGELPPLIIAIGLDAGQLLEAIERRTVTTKVLAIEPMPTRDLLANRRWRGWLDSGRLTLLTGPEYAGSADAWRLINRQALRPPMLVSPALQQKAPDAVAAAKAVARQVVLGAASNEEARKRFAGPYLLNTLRNLAVIASEGDVADLTNLFAGVPAVVVGAGPSLDDNMGALKGLANRALIVATDTAVRPLLAADIHPDFVVAVDPSEENARHLLHLPDTRAMWFISEPSLASGIFAQFTDRTFTFKVSNHHPWPWIAAHDLDRGKLETWGSVMTTAFDLTCRLGCDPIVFAGADLAYTDGVLYCRNTVYEPEWRHLKTTAERTAEFKPFLAQKVTSEQPDLNGQVTLTAPRFVQFRDWILSRAARETGRRILNGTGRGLLHGRSIGQVDLGALALPEPSDDKKEWHRRIHKARRQGQNTNAKGREALAESCTAQSAPTDVWLEECRDTATQEQIDVALTSAHHSLTQAIAKTRYGASLREYYDSQIHSVEDTRLMSHQNYRAARLQAPHRQAHILLDFLQRSYSPTESAHVADVVRAASELRTDVRALDFGCGAGRNMEVMVEAGFKVDGIDVSTRMIEYARANPLLKDCEFFLSRGSDCGEAPDGAYDLAYSNICFQFICARSIRRDLLRALARTLRPGGVAVIHFRFHPDRDSSNVPIPWSADDVAGHSRGTEGEVWPTPDAFGLIYADFSQFFADVRIQVVDFAADDTLPRHAQLTISGATANSLGQRIHPAVQPNQSPHQP